MNLLDWAPNVYPKLITASHAGREYVIWEMENLDEPGTPVYQIAQRTNVQRRIKWHRRATLPSIDEALVQAHRWAFETIDRVC